MRGGFRQQLRGVLKGFLDSHSKNYAVLGLGRLQLGELPEKTMNEWVPPPDDPSPRPPSRNNRGAFPRFFF